MDLYIYYNLLRVDYFQPPAEKFRYTQNNKSASFNKIMDKMSKSLGEEWLQV